MRALQRANTQTTPGYSRRLFSGSSLLAAAVLVFSSACETWEWASMDSAEPFPRDTHSLLPPTDGERVAISRFATEPDEQPITFNHSIHAGAIEDGGMGMDCQYCHYVARKSIHAGVPASQVCQGCHKMVDTKERPELEKLKGYLDAGEEIPWVRVHDLPDFVHFDHSAHVVSAGIECQECHGEMQKETVAVKPKNPISEPGMMEMGWCLQCHKTHPSVEENYGKEAPLRRAELKDCWTCHK